MIAVRGAGRSNYDTLIIFKRYTTPEIEYFSGVPPVNSKWYI